MQEKRRGGFHALEKRIHEIEEEDRQQERRAREVEEKERAKRKPAGKQEEEK